MDSNLDPHADAVFAALPPSVQRRIDGAFDKVLEDSSLDDSRPSKRRKLDAAAGASMITPAVEEAGGFIIEDAHSDAGGFLVEDAGGFVLEDENAPPETTSNHIPLALVPAALELLSLPPDDVEVLAVFANAASGWADASSSRRSKGDGDEQVVSRKDWRSVCAVLLEGEVGSDVDEGAARDVAMSGGREGTTDLDVETKGGDDAGPATRTRRRTGARRVVVQEYEESDASEDEYREEEESDVADDDEDEDEYLEGRGAKPTRARTKPRPSVSSENGEVPSTALTAQQHTECRKAFALFFPDVDSDSPELDTCRLGSKDVVHAAGVLKEKIGAEQVTEMLSMFSTAPDGSMALEDFERMMSMTGLV